MGSVTVNVTVSSRLSPVSEPPWSCVICRAMARPSPAPPVEERAVSSR